jgi:hypothetical protein
MKRVRSTTLAASVLVFAAMSLGQGAAAQAGDWGFSFGFHAPHGHLGYHHYAPPVHYHPRVVVAPRFHYDHVYHPHSYHWTPDIGHHSHGHVDVVPHYGGHYGHHHHHYGW